MLEVEVEPVGASTGHGGVEDDVRSGLGPAVAGLALVASIVIGLARDVAFETLFLTAVAFWWTWRPTTTSHR